jgi:hypothetical protein
MGLFDTRNQGLSLRRRYQNLAGAGAALNQAAPQQQGLMPTGQMANSASVLSRSARGLKDQEAQFQQNQQGFALGLMRLGQDAEQNATHNALARDTLAATRENNALERGVTLAGQGLTRRGQDLGFTTNAMDRNVEQYKTVMGSLDRQEAAYGRENAAQARTMAGLSRYNTPESVAAFGETGDYGALQPLQKPQRDPNAGIIGAGMRGYFYNNPEASPEDAADYANSFRNRLQGPATGDGDTTQGAGLVPPAPPAPLANNAPTTPTQPQQPALSPQDQQAIAAAQQVMANPQAPVAQRQKALQVLQLHGYY